MNREEFDLVAPAAQEVLLRRLAQSPFTKLLGLQPEEVRRDYARMRLPYRHDLTQPAGLVHGGAIASLIDTAVVGAIFSTLDGPPRKLVTVSLHVQYLDGVASEDLIAESRVRRRGRSIVFLEVEVKTAAGREIAHGELVYRVSAGS